jgi:hypothetical protein
MHNKKSKRAAVSSDTDGNQLATGNKKRRLVNGVKKGEEEEEEEESTIKKEEEIEDDLYQDKDEDSRKPSAVVKEEEDVTEDVWEDSKQPPAAIKKEEGYGYETEENEDGEGDLQLDRDEPVDSMKPSASVENEAEDEDGHKYSTGKIDEKSNWEQLVTREDNDDQATYLPDEIASTKGLLPPARPSDTDTSVKTAPSPSMTVTKPKSAKPVAAATPVSIVQAKSALARNRADEKLAASGRGNVCNENKTLSEETEQPRSTREEDKSTHICGYATRSQSNTNTVKRKYSLRSLYSESNKKGARSKSIRKEKGYSTSFGEVKRSPMARTDEDAFGRGIATPLDEASDTSDRVEGIVDLDDATFDHRDAQWNIMLKKLQGYFDKHGHCELFGAVDRFTFILNTPTNIPPCLSP